MIVASRIISFFPPLVKGDAFVHSLTMASDEEGGFVEEKKDDCSQQETVRRNPEYAQAL
jgi:hypothetical protein